MNPVVPETNGGVGTSIKGCALYCLHDKESRNSAERVMWTETVNLATQDPTAAWKIMAATAIDSGRLKEAYHDSVQAGLPEDKRVPYRASKPTKNTVFHYVLTWHPDESDGLTKDEMVKHAKGTLKQLGGQDLQALIVAHSDQAHKHVHVMVSRIHPVTGRAVPVESKSQSKLSAYALKLDKARGFTYAPQRERNAELRKAGIEYRAERRIPRKIYEQQQAAKDAAKRGPAFTRKRKKAENAKDYALAVKERALLERQRKRSFILSHAHKTRKAMINSMSDDAKRDVRRMVSQKYAGLMDAQSQAQHDDIMRLNEADKNVVSRALETIKAVPKALKLSEAETLRGRASELFSSIGRSGFASTIAKKQHKMDREALQGRFRSERRAEVSKVEKTRQEAISSNYGRYQDEYLRLSARRDAENAAMQRRWRKRGQERKEIWAGLEQAEKTRSDYQTAASPSLAKKAKGGRKRNNRQRESNKGHGR